MSLLELLLSLIGLPPLTDVDGDEPPPPPKPKLTS